MKPITYYAQTPVITDLCSLYGPNLQQLDRLTRYTLLGALTDMLMVFETDDEDEPYGLYDAICDSSWDVELTDQEQLLECCQELDSELTHDVAKGLMLGILEGL